jgi:hypothetical protein
MLQTARDVDCKDVNWNAVAYCRMETGTWHFFS